MKATINKQTHTGNVRQNRKENHFLAEYAAMVVGNKPDYLGNKIKSVVILRIYGTNAKNYACIWVHDDKKNIHIGGGGGAGGYGYHRPSAAAQYAINDAGIQLDQRIDGVGESAMIEAVRAIAKACGYRKVHIHTAHA